MAHTRITINGRDYESVDAMPAEVRRLYEDTLRQMGPGWEDRDGNGVPDRFESAVDLGALRATTTVENRIVVNGRTYGNPAEMPADVRRMFEDAMAAAKGPGGIRVTRTELKGSIAPSEAIDAATPGRPRGAAGPVEVSFTIRPWMLVVAVLLGALGWLFAGR